MSSIVGSGTGRNLASGLVLVGLRHRIPADVLLLTTVVFWSFHFTAAKYALTHGFEPLAYSSLRFGTAALFFTAFTWVREQSVRVRRSDGLLLIVAALLGIWLNQLTFVYSVRLTTAATVALVFGTLPIWVALVSRAFGQERLRFRHWLATGVSFAGVALVALGTTGGLRGDLGGVLLAFGAAATWGAYSVAMGPLMQRYSAYRISAVCLVVGCVPLLASSAKVLLEQDWSEPNAIAWAAALYGLVFSLILTNIMWFTAIDRVGAARSSLYANLQPFLGAMWALLVLAEEMTPVQVAGGFVIGAGILLARRARPAIAGAD